MKKLFGLALMLGSVSSMAATTATLNLKGIIPVILDISVAAETLATNLPLDQAVNAQKVGTVTERSNSGTGYKVSASSANGGKLVRTGDTSSFITYQMSYSSNTIALNTTPTQIAKSSARGQFNRDLRISYSKPADYTASGEYTDTVTLTIAAN
jgi:hypothetical protein